MIFGNLRIEYINGDKWRVINDHANRFYFAYKNITFEPHTGFITDLATIPRIFCTLLPKNGKYAPAAVIHDYIINSKQYTKEMADKAFRQAMKELNVSWIKRELIYVTVKYFGRY